MSNNSTSIRVSEDLDILIPFSKSNFRCIWEVCVPQTLVFVLQ